MLMAKTCKLLSSWIFYLVLIMWHFIVMIICPTVIKNAEVWRFRVHVGYSHFAVTSVLSTLYSVSQKKIHPPAACSFLTFFDKRLRILNQLFTHLLYVPIYARLQIATHAFRRLRKSLIALLIVICGKSSQICCFYHVNKRQQWRHLLSKQTYKLRSSAVSKIRWVVSLSMA